ncbi:MAG: eukaryotic-like serine/threonine-protein kinase [Acidobacteriota bacterium]|jgi:serine/threonine-protein kinase|nr:eukaryotic-like serine/threonine-protein kinase [Acidobacteriota bacterium]
MIGQVFGNYKIEQKLGEGGMGEVFRGVDMMLEREVAIKFLRPELASQSQVVERFRSEAVTLAKLNHPNIATLFNFMRQGDSFIMVLEFVRGVTLDHVIQQRGAIPVEQAVPIFCQVLDGIQEAHNYGIIHRDIKPANMMLTEKGTLKVLDFGIARILGTARMTRQGNIIGTIEYMSPEQVRGFETDARSDIYSLGMLLYEMLTGRCPFDIQNEFELMRAQIEQYPMPPRQLNPAIPEAVEQAIWKSIAKDPAQRFQNAAEFRGFLLNAGYAATGRLEPLAVGDPAAYGTRPVTQPPSSYPPSPFMTTPMQQGYQTQPQPNASPSQPGMPTPSQPGTPTPSQPGMPPPQASNPGLGANAVDPMSATLIGPPPETNAVAAKETRIGPPTVPPSAAATGAKETRIGTGPVVAGAAARQPQGFAPPQQQQGFAPPQQQGFMPPQPPPRAQQQSFMSKLTWVHFAGAGAAALVVMGVIVGIAFFAFSGSKKAKEPLKPASLAEEPSKPTPQPTEQQPQPVQPTTPADGGDQTTVGTQTPVGSTGIPVEHPPSVSTPVAASDSPTQGTSRTAQSKPAQAKPAQAKPADAGDAARKRREAALRALDQ